ncbi:MAG: VaFE repeat-containing surface-anchored protein [Clostridium sp.]|nr:VaFE repeat-containing surface-anchored protein [Clostridium sp.]
MRKLFKRIIAVMMALLMCIPNNAATVLAAGIDTKETTEYTAILNSVEHGSIQFTDYQAVSTKTFNKGDSVQVTLVPDTGYKTSQLKITNTDTGKVLAQKDTSDNRFAFTMPAKNVTVSASFAPKEQTLKLPDENPEGNAEQAGSQESEEENPEDDGEGASEYKEESSEPLGTEEPTLTTDIITLNLDEDIAEEVEQIAQDEIKAADGVDEKTYAFDEPKLVSDYDENGMAQTAHYVTMMYTIADKTQLALIPKGKRILEAIFEPEYITAFYTNIYENVPIYATKESDDYFVAFLDAAKIRGLGECVDYSIGTVDTLNPEFLDDRIKYDDETGLLYIPKTFYYDAEGHETAFDFKTQLVISSDVSNNTGRVRTVIENHNKDIDIVAEEQTVDVDLFDMSVRIPLSTTTTAKNVDLAHVKVYINDSSVPAEFNEDEIDFHADTGELEFAHTGLTLYSVKIEIEDSTFAEKVIQKITTKTNAVSASNMKSLPCTIDLENQTFTSGDDTIKVVDTIKAGNLYTYKSAVFYNPCEENIGNDSDLAAAALGGIANSANYMYGPNNADIYDGIKDTDDSFTLADDMKGTVSKIGSTSTTNGSFSGKWIDFVAQPPGAKKLTVKYTNYTGTGKNHAIYLASHQYEWNVSKKKRTVNKVSVYTVNNVAPYVDIRCEPKESTAKDNAKSVVTMKKTSGSWSSPILKETVGDVKRTVDGTERSCNPLSMLALQCAQHTTGKNSNLYSFDTTVYMRILKHDTKNKYIIFGLATAQGSSQAGSAIYKVRYDSDEPSINNCSLKINKEIENPALYRGNKNYNVDGAIYTLYTDAACTNEVEIADETVEFEIEANSSDNTFGSAQRNDIPAGTYYLKENPVGYTESSGVNTNPTVYTVTLTEDNDKDNPVIVNVTVAASDAEPVPTDLPYLNITKYGNTTNKDAVTATFGLYQDTNEDGIYKMVRRADVAGSTCTWADFPMDNGASYDFDNNGLPLGNYYIAEIGRASNLTDRGKLTANGKTYPIPTAQNPFRFTVEEQLTADPGVKEGCLFINGELVCHGSDTAAFTIEVDNEFKYYGFKVKKEDATDPDNAAGHDLTASFQLIAGDGENGTKVSVNPNPSTLNSDTGTSYNKGDVINIPGIGTTFKTDKDGNFTSAPYLLSAGTYTIKEVQAPNNYRLNSVTQTFTVGSTAGEGTIITGPVFKNEPSAGSFAMQKYDNELDAATGQGAGDLNATFELVNNTGQPVVYKNKTYENEAVMETFTLNASNNYAWFSGADTQADGALRLGSYIIREKTAGTGYKNTKVKDAYGLDTNNELHFTLTKDYEVAWSGMDSFASTVQSHYTAAYPSVKGFDDTKISGNTPLNTLENAVQRTGFEVHKVDWETNDTNNHDMTASFKLVYRNTVNDKPVVVDKNKDGKLDIAAETFHNGDTVYEFTTDKDGNFTSPADLLPYTGGKDSGIYYELYETKAPKNYYTVHEFDPDVRFFIHAAGEHTTEYSCNKTEADGFTFAADQKVPDVRFRYDINFTKKKEGEIDSKLLANVPFRITLLDDEGNEVESHVVWTDESGYYDSASDYTPHGNNTNYGDNYTTYEKNGETYYQLDKSGLTENRNGAKLIGTWYYGFKETDALKYADAKIFDYAGKNNEIKVGAFIAGNYTIEELRCEANEGLRLFSDTFNIQAFDNYYNKDLGTYDNADYGLNTVALTQDTDSHYAVANDELVIVDEVLYSGLAKGETFKLVTSVHDADTGELLLNADGTEAVLEKTFVSKAVNSVVKVEIDFDASGYAGRSIVIYEQVYDKDGKLLVEEADPANEDQQIHFPAITTELTDTRSEDHLAKAAKDTKLKDVITFKNLEPNRTYKIKGYLVDPETLDYARDDKGSKITAEESFKPTKSSGTVDVEYAFDAETLAGKTLVAFEYVTKGGFEIALHEDIEDAAQTIHFPEIGTTAYDEENGTQMSYADDTVTVKDTVVYKNVIAGYTYTMTGTLVDKADGETIKDAEGNVVTGTVQFTAEDTEGTVDVTFTFDGTGMDSHTLVAFENLYITKAVTDDNGDTTYEDVDIAEHSDMEDEAETIYLPGIRTTAKDTENGSQMSCFGETVSITDTVAYQNLIPGLKYQVEGCLMDKATGEKALDAEGNEITAMTEFMPEEADGTVDVAYEFNGSHMEGYTVVAYERMYVIITSASEEEIENLETGEVTTEVTETEERHLIASHEDIEDEGQMIHFPNIRTLAYDGENQLNVTKSGEKEVIKDTVAYANVTAGEEYTITGRLYDKETGEVLKDTDGNDITASTVFVAQDTTGTVEIEFNVDTSKLAGHRLVAFEKLLYKGFEVGRHENPDDEDETVYIPKIGTTLTDKEGMHLSLAEDKAALTDTVQYEKLAPGYTYILVGQLMNKATNEPVKLENADNAESIMAKLEETIAANNAMANPEEEQEKEPETDKAVYIVGKDIEAGYYKLIGTPDEHGNVFASWWVYASENNQTVPEDTDKAVANGVVTDNTNPEYIRLVNNQILQLEEDVVSISASEEEAADKVNAVLKAYYDGLDEEALNQEPAASADDAEETEDENTEDTENAADAEPESVVDAIVNKRKVIDGTFDWGSLSDGTQPVFAETYEDDLKALDGTAVCMVFTPEEADGSVDLVFEVNASELNGVTTVAFEELYINGFSVAEHKDIEDEGQSVHFPDIHTTATDADNKMHYAQAGTETVIRDVVDYKNVIPGETYRVSGTLMDKTTQAAVLNADGTPVTAETEFAAEAADGTVTLDFVFDSTGYAGHSLVVYEDLYTNGILVGRHEDLDDKDQTVNIINIHTTAIDGKTKIHVAKEGTTTIIDTVSYEGLTPGETYVMSGILMDKETKESLKSSKTGNPVATLITDIFGQSNEYISETAFVPEASAGEIQIKFNLDSTDFDGKTIVAFEKLYYGTTVIAKHEDIEDTEQTVYVPKIGTKASVDGKSEAVGKKDTKLVDKVEYTNLVPGKKYTVKGTLMDKKTGKAFTVNGKKVTAKKTFTPKKANGTVKLTFTFDSTNAETLVVFERLYYKDIKVAEHTDIKDKEQTVTFKTPGETTGTPGTPSEKVKTGDSWMLILLLLLIAGGSFGAYVYTKKKKQKKHKDVFPI